MEIRLANPRGFCAGVDRAIDIVNRALEVFGPPIHVRHEVVHNRYVVEDLRQRGAVFVEELHEVPDDAIVIFSAHGVSKAVQEEAERRQLQVFDATCPLVTKVHMEVIRYAREGRESILIGHAGHPEVEGTMGQYDKSYGGDIYLVEDEADVASLTVRDESKLAFVTQTTLSVDDTARVIDALRQRFPAILGPKREDICYATTNRQDAVRQLAYGILAVGGGIADIFAFGAKNGRKALAQGINDSGGIVHTQGGLGHEGQFALIAHRQARHVGFVFHQINVTAIGFVVLPHGAFHFRMASMANQDTFAAFTGIPNDFHMHLGHQWAGRIENLQLTPLGLFLHRFGDTVGTEDNNSVVRHFVQLFHKNRAALAQVFDHIAVMHHFVTDMNRWPEHFQSAVDDVDGTIHASTEATGISETNFHNSADS